MECKHVKYEVLADSIAIITIDSPKTLNALNLTILEELNARLDAIGDGVRVLIITGEGKAFVAGADISQMRDFNEEQGYEFSKFGAGVFRKIESLRIPTIAAVNGFALGGGCELAMSCDIRLASAKAVFGQPEVKLGILPGFSGSVRMPRIVGVAKAKELIYTGANINAEEALRIGLVNHVFEPDVLMEEAVKMAQTIIANAPRAVEAAKESIDRNYDMDIDAGIELECRLFGTCFATKDQKEGMTAFLEKRKATFENK